MYPFNVRVYGIYVTESTYILLSDERIRGKLCTKFPGGGLKFGEGLRDCLKRELKEELQLEVQVLHHIYTTDFCQLSAFNTKEQLIAVYYRMSGSSLYNGLAYHITQHAILENTSQTFRLIPLASLQPKMLTFPVDRHVLSLLLNAKNNLI